MVGSRKGRSGSGILTLDLYYGGVEKEEEGPGPRLVLKYIILHSTNHSSVDISRLLAAEQVQLRHVLLGLQEVTHSIPGLSSKRGTLR